MKLIYFLLPLMTYSMSLGDFICQSAKICGRPPTIQEFCDVFDLCFDGFKKTPPTPIEVLNKKLNKTESCTLSMVDIEMIQRQFPPTPSVAVTTPSIGSPSVTTPSVTTPSVTTPSVLTPSVADTDDVDVVPMSPEVITLIVLGSVAGLGLLIGLGFVIKKKIQK